MQELIKQTVLRLRSEAVSAQSYQRKAADLIESQAAEIAKYKSLCDQMGSALEIMLKEATYYGEAWAKCYVADYDRIAVDSKELRFKLLAVCHDKLSAIPEALEAWRAMK